jgi:hypothetical protein
VVATEPGELVSTAKSLAAEKIIAANTNAKIRLKFIKFSDNKVSAFF